MASITIRNRDDRLKSGLRIQVAVHGRSMEPRLADQPDAQITAIARSRVAVLATRNVPDFEGNGIGMVSPSTETRLN